MADVVISFHNENGEPIYDSDGKAMCNTVPHKNIEYTGNTITIHHSTPGSNASRSSQCYVNGEPVYDSHGRAIYDTFHYERWD
jgi:hypothetical protein